MATFDSFTKDLLRHGEPDDLVEEGHHRQLSVPEEQSRTEKTS
jgi:hypothetical protein